MSYKKISDHQTKDGLAKGLAQWVIRNDGKSVTIHGTEDEAKALDIPKRKEKVVMNENEGTFRVLSVKEEILDAITDAPQSTTVIANIIGRPVPSTRRTLSELAEAGRVIKNHVGAYFAPLA